MEAKVATTHDPRLRTMCRDCRGRRKPAICVEFTRRWDPGMMIGWGGVRPLCAAHAKPTAVMLPRDAKFLRAGTLAAIRAGKVVPQ